MADIQIQTGQDSPPPTPEPMDVVIEANVVINSVGDSHWRPLSSISHNALTTDTSEPENPDNEGKAAIPLRSKSRVSIAPDATISGGESLLRVQGLTGHVPRDPPPTRAASTVSHKTNRVKRRSRSRTAPGKLEQTAELNRAFATMDDRTKVTFDGIRGNTRTSLNEFNDRVCRPYSVYTVTKQCEMLAISPFGGPLMNSAAGRYRERYLTRHRPDVVQDIDTSGESVKIKFQRFYDNLNLLSINVKRIPFGTLRKPPPKQTRKVENKTKSVPAQLHKYTKERVANLHESMGRQESQSGNRVDGKRLGVMSVEYKVAMEVSSNLEKYRRSRPSNLPGLPHFLPGRTDASRLQTQTDHLLTPGELSLKEGISTNLYDQERSKRFLMKATVKPPRRVKSPPLSKLSRERFLPDAQKRRDQETWAELRIGRPVTPPASLATTTRPLTVMTTHNSCSGHVQKTKSAKHDGASNQENETAGNADESQKEESESVTVAPDEKNSENTQTGRIRDKITDSDENKPCDEQHGCSTNENGAKSSSSKRSDKKTDNSDTPLSSALLVMTIPDSDGALEVDTATNTEGGVEVTSEDEQSTEVNDGVIADEENIVSADPVERKLNDQNDTNEQVEH